MFPKVNLKKVAACTLTVAMLTPLMGSAALADPPPHAKAYGREKVPFKLIQLTDIRGHWAEDILAEMNLTGLIKGYDDNKFQPSNVVKNVEAITMLIRALGLEEKAKGELKSDFSQAKKIPEWAKGYIQVALDQKLLLPEELQKFNPNQGMKRAELCAILARALDLKPEDGYENKLDFADVNAIPEDLLKFVCVIVENGIMKGYDNNVFQPNKPVTRAEMAVLVERLGDLFHENNKGRLEGTVAQLTSDHITARIGDTVKELPLDDGVLVYLNREKAELEDLAVGDKIRLTIREGKVVLIRAQRSAVVETVHQGRLIRLVLGTNSRVTITDKDGIELNFRVDSNTRIWVDGERALPKDLEVGRDVQITAQGDVAGKIEM